MQISETSALPEENSKPISCFQYLVILLCAMCMLVDGFDVQAMSYVAPALMKAWSIDRSLLGPVLSAALFGMLVGSLLLAGIADIVGRRPALIASLAWVAIAMSLTPFSHAIGQLALVRFVAGLGMGVVIPNALALGGEYSPPRLRVTVVMAVSSGYVIGGVVGGATAAFVVVAFGWGGVFYTGAVLTGCLAFLTLFSLPESLQFGLLCRPDDCEAAALIERFGLDEEPAQSGWPEQKGSSLKVVVGRDRIASTLLLWLAGSCNMGCAYFLAAWIPLLMSSNGYSSGMSLLAGAALWGGGLIGNYLLSHLIDRIAYGPMLFANFVMGGFAIVGLGCFTQSAQIAIPWIMLAGFSVIGGQSGLYSIAVLLYPTQGRATGTGLASGVGRIGAVLGPVIGGYLMTLSWAADKIFLASAVPMLITAVSIGVLALNSAREVHPGTFNPRPPD